MRFVSDSTIGGRYMTMNCSLSTLTQMHTFNRTPYPMQRYNP